MRFGSMLSNFLLNIIYLSYLLFLIFLHLLVLSIQPCYCTAQHMLLQVIPRLLYMLAINEVCQEEWFLPVVCAAVCASLFVVVMVKWLLAPSKPPYIPKRLRRVYPVGWLWRFIKDMITVGCHRMLLAYSQCSAAVSNYKAEQAKARNKYSKLRKHERAYRLALDQAARSASLNNGPHSPSKSLLLFLRLFCLDVTTLSGSIMLNHIMALQSTTNRLVAENIDHSYDSDSFLIAINNCSSRCITNCLSDYIDTPEDVNIPVQGLSCTVRATKMGTAWWLIKDDNGVVHSFLIQETYYNCKTPCRLLSPQHWSQTQQNGYGTWCAMHHDLVKLFWKSNTKARMILLDKSSNVAYLQSAPAHSSFNSFCAKISEVSSPINESELLAMPAVVPTISDDEETTVDDNSDEDSLDNEPIMTSAHPDLPAETFGKRVASEATTEDRMEFSLEGVTLNRIPEDPQVQYDTPQAELLAWHYQLGHLPFAWIKSMAERGYLPARLGKCKAPRCAACMFGKAMHRAWRMRAPVNAFSPPPVTAPGNVIGINQLVSSTPGLIAQMHGFLTREWYKVTTMFVDYFSGLSYVHFQQSLSAAETILAKLAFKHYAKSHGVLVKHYHADNGIFAEKDFVQQVHESWQIITFCAVNAHHQNGRAEKQIHDLQETAWTMMLHARQRWPSAVTSNLWPYAIWMANDIANASPGFKDQHASPIELFLQVDIAPWVCWSCAARRTARHPMNQHLCLAVRPQAERTLSHSTWTSSLSSH